LIFKCDTIEELAQKLSIPSDDLIASVNRYNELCEKGVARKNIACVLSIRLLIMDATSESHFLQSVIV